MGKVKREYILAFTTVLLWGTLPSISKLIINKLSPVTTTFYVSLIAAMTLLIINAVRKGPDFYRIYSLRDYCRIAGLGFLGLFCYTTLYYIGLERLTSQLAGIINYMWPVMIILFSCLILKERFTIRKVTAMSVSFAGMMLICAQGMLGEASGNSLAGMLCCFAAAVCYGLYSALNKKYDYDQWIVLNVAFGVTALLSGIWCFADDGFVEPDGPMLAGLLWIGVFVNGIAYVLWGIAINIGETAKISILAYICPFLSLVFGRVLLDEHISPLSFAGVILIIGGVLIQSEIGKKKKHKQIT